MVIKVFTSLQTLSVQMDPAEGTMVKWKYFWCTIPLNATISLGKMRLGIGKLWGSEMLMLELYCSCIFKNAFSSPNFWFLDLSLLRNPQISDPQNSNESMTMSTWSIYSPGSHSLPLHIHNFNAICHCYFVILLLSKFSCIQCSMFWKYLSSL